MRRQFAGLERKDGMIVFPEGYVPDYRSCVDIVTKAALRQMIGPGLLAVGMPVLVGLVLFFCGAGALPFWRQWRARPVNWLVTISALLLYHLLLFMSFRHAPVLEANLINYLWPLCIILFTPLLDRKSTRLNSSH